MKEGERSSNPRVLMLGKGWFPTTVGGLDRYYRSLFELLPKASGVVIGPADDAPSTIAVVSHPQMALPRRLLAFWQAAQRGGDTCDLVDAHFALYAAAPLLIGRLRGCPVVFHFQGPWAYESVSSGDASRVKFHLRRALERRALREADAIVVLSSAFRRLLVERYRISPWDVHVWAPGVSLETFTPGDRDRARARFGLTKSAFVVACTRRLVPRMGIDVLLDAWAELDGQLPYGSTLLIVGDGPLRDALARRAEAFGLSVGVRLLGQVPDEELLDLYRAADVAVVPTAALEGFGLVVLEAAACGTPSLVSNIGGLPEAVYELDSTLIVPAPEVQAWVHRLRDAARGALPTREATRRFAERFDWSTLADRHRVLYRRVAEARRDERLRVVYLDHVARLSGAEIALLRLLPHLNSVNAHVILGEEGPLVDRLHTAGVSVEVIPVAPEIRDLRKDAVRPGGVSASTVGRTGAHIVMLARRLRQLRPDLVHSNSLKSGVYGGIAARAAGVPLVWHLHDRLSTDYLPPPAVIAVRFLLRHLPAAVVANSAATLSTIDSRHSKALRAVVPNVVSLPDRFVRECPPSDAGVTFGMVGRIARWKGQDLFLRAFAQAFPHGFEKARVIGSAMFGEDDYERELIALAASLGLAGRVEFRGFREDVFAELASLDVLIHASVIAEPFGQVVLEGMAAGLPVIAADAGGPSELITDRENGLLFRTGEVASLAQAMRQLGDRPGERARLGTAALTAADGYRPGAVARQLTSIYDSVLALGR